MIDQKYLNPGVTSVSYRCILDNSAAALMTREFTMGTSMSTGYCIGNAPFALLGSVPNIFAAVERVRLTTMVPFVGSSLG
jgi:hypothetical protein